MNRNVHRQQASSHLWKPPVETLIFAVVLIKTSHCKVCAWALPRLQQPSKTHPAACAESPAHTEEP